MDQTIIEIKERLRCLKDIKKLIKDNEDRISEALYQDLKKSSFESFLTEYSIIYSQIDFFINNLTRISKPKSIKIPLALLPGKAILEYVPKGLVLIISPWNYPFQLTFVPLIASIAAGNACMIKPSEHAAQSAEVIFYIISKLKEKWPITCMLGDHKTVEDLLQNRFDHIFYTGSINGGKVIMEKAAQHLSTVTLELGGKSPVIIDETADIKIAAKRIMWGKCLNAGQTCIAPDYILIKSNMLEDFVKEIKDYMLTNMKDIKNNQNYGRIINEYHTKRLVNYLSDGKILLGGDYDIENKFIDLTVITDVKSQSPLLHEEIFGPILPIITYENFSEVISFINKRSSPLVIYIFSINKHNINMVKKSCLSGSIAINDVVSFLGIKDLPFGGIGLSGMGRYHGASGFYELSHHRPCYERSNYLDLPMRYPPYPEWVRKLFRKIL